jgi:Ca2+-binding EF-hand superfamily protein
MSVSSIGGLGAGYGSYSIFNDEEMKEKLAARFAEMDIDGDGALNAEELGIPEEQFSQADADGDGLVTEDEMLAMAASMMRKGPPMAMMGGGQFSAMTLEEITSQIISENDTDGDGALSLEEGGIPEDKFSEADADGDGVVTQAELQADMEAQRSEHIAAIFSEKDEDEDGGLSSEELGVSEEEFSALDTNEDGVVSQAELEAAYGTMAPPPGPPPMDMAGMEEFADMSSEDIASTILDETDTDGDGVISQAELEAAIEAQKETMASGGFLGARGLTAYMFQNRGQSLENWANIDLTA